MTSHLRRSSHLSRHLASLRLERGLRPGQLAARLGASNLSKVGSLIRSFELGEPLSDHWLQRLIAELQPDPADLQRCLELDQAEADALLERERLEWEEWADESIEPRLSVRYIAGFGRTIPVPEEQRSSWEQAERWAAEQMKSFVGLRGVLSWSRRQRSLFVPGDSTPRRPTVTFVPTNCGAWMQVSGSQKKFLLSRSG